MFFHPLNVNPFEGKTADMIDATNLPLNVGISGGSYKDKDEKIVGTWLDITDLNSKNSTRYTCSEAGFSYRLNYITPDKSERFEIIYNYSIVSIIHPKGWVRSGLLLFLENFSGISSKNCAFTPLFSRSKAISLPFFAVPDIRTQVYPFSVIGTANSIT